MSYCDHLIETEATIFPMLFDYPKASNADKDKLRARVLAVMKAQGIAAVVHQDTVYIRSGESLLALPCVQSLSVKNTVPLNTMPALPDPLTAEQIMAIFDASEPSDEDIAEAARYNARIDIMGDDFSSRLPFRMTNSRM